ncbi:MAG: hypothetical protein D6778_05905 [Nitrospirae bacterium]|nr:MAG: hypothetical protein D6778_05905 [Nitrospirota bacterium]
MKQVLKERNDIVFYIKVFPLKKLHPEAYKKSLVTACAKKKSNEKAKEVFDHAIENKPLPEPDCKTDWVDQNLALGQKIGVTGTPTMVFPNGKVISGLMKAKDLIKTIEANQK